MWRRRAALAIRMAISPRFAIRHLLKGDEEVAAVVKCLERTARRLEEWVDIYSVGCLNRLLLFPGFRYLWNSLAQEQECGHTARE